jgi:protocatechuate 3,4-dioxygenase beta subunit
LWSTIAGAELVHRSDITESVQTGVPFTLTLTLVNVNDSCTPLSGIEVYIWHCNKDGEYSGYSSTENGNHTGETWLRGVQSTDSDGNVTFTTIYPGWYGGRITHIHLRAYMGNNLEVTTQLAFPEAITTAVYNTSLYTNGQNTSVASNAADHVFSDGTTYQLLTLTGNTTNGYVGTLEIGIAL